eukprot:10007146-Karenia_brevis.AAC.1
MVSWGVGNMVCVAVTIVCGGSGGDGCFLVGELIVMEKFGCWIMLICVVSHGGIAKLWWMDNSGVTVLVMVNGGV